MSKDWISGAIKHPGSLRKSLGVKGEKNIPTKKLNSAAKKGGKLGARARLAKTLKGLHHGEYGDADTGDADMDSHGMQMGGSGFGMTHGYDGSDEQPNRDNSHEFKGCK